MQIVKRAVKNVGGNYGSYVIWAQYIDLFYNNFNK